MIKTVQRSARARRGRVHARTKGTFKLGIEFVNWGAWAIATSTASARSARTCGLVPFHQYWLKHAPGRQGRAAGPRIRSTPQRRAPRQVHAPGHRPAQLAAGRHRLRLPLRRQPVRALPARLRRGARRAAHRGQGRAVSTAARDRRLRRRGGAGERRARRRRLLHRLLRLPRPADRADAEDRLRGLDALAALRPRGGRALRVGASQLHALHALHRARGRLAVAHSAAAPHRQRLCLLQPAHQRGRGHRDPAGQPRRRGAGRAAHAALRHRQAQASSGTATWWRSAWPAASWSRWNRPAST